MVGRGAEGTNDENSENMVTWRVGGFAKSKTGRFWGDLRRNFPKQGVAQDEDLGRTQPDFVEQPRFQSHHRDLAASRVEIGLGRALDLHELMNATPN